MSKDSVDELATLLDDKCLLDDSFSSKYGTIPDQLIHFECPFLWKYNYISGDRTLDTIERKLSEMNDDDEELVPWKMFVLNLILLYEYANCGELEEALEKQMECDAILDGQSNNEFEHSAPYMGYGLRHVSLACKCILLFALKLEDELEKTLNMIVSFQDLEMKDKASILCIKGAYCCELGYKGIKESVELFEKAVDMDRECAEWSFLLGRSLGRLRRMEKRNSLPDPRELKALEYAVSISKNVCFMVLLAQAYRETSRNLFFCKRREMSTFKPFCDSLNKKSSELYREVLNEGKENVHVFVRCALGFLRLPKPWKDLTEAKNCILKALDLAPQNPMANHVAGQYFSQVNDTNQAMHYLTKAAAFGVYGAEIDLLTLKRKQNESYDPIADIQRLLVVYKEAPLQEATLCYLGTYLYVVQNNFKEAFKYWLQVIEMDINSEKLKLHFDIASPRRTEININRVVITELIKLLDAGKITDAERKLYDRIISKYIQHHPGLVVAATEIDVSKYKNCEFEYRSWKNGSFCKSQPSSQNVPLTKDSKYRDQGPSCSRDGNNAPCKTRSEPPLHSNAPSALVHSHSVPITKDSECRGQGPSHGRDGNNAPCETRSEPPLHSNAPSGLVHSHSVPITKDSECRGQVPSHGRDGNNAPCETRSEPPLHSNAPSGLVQSHPTSSKISHDNNHSNRNVPSRPGYSRGRARGKGWGHYRSEEASWFSRSGPSSNMSLDGGPCDRIAPSRPAPSRGRGRGRRQPHNRPVEETGSGTTKSSHGALKKYQ